MVFAMRRPRTSEGSTLIEVIVAMLVLIIVLVSVAHVLVTQIGATTRTKDEAVAEGQLTGYLSRLRAVPFQELANGLVASDPTATTAHIQKTGASWTFSDLKDRRSGTGETVLHFTPGTTSPPPALYPHVSASKVNGITFTSSVFPTQYETPPVNTTSHSAVIVPGVVRVTVIVSWDSGAGRLSTITGQALVSTVGRCNETTGTTGPCKPSFTTAATAGSGTVTVRPAPGAPYPIEGVAFTSVSLVLAGSSSYGDLVRTSLVEGSAQSTGATISGSGSAGSGQVSRVSTRASNDPASGDPAYQPSPPLQSAAAVTATGSGNSITASPSSGDSGTSVSTVAALVTQDCVTLAGTPQATGTPCGSGQALQHSSAGITAAFGSGSGALGTAQLAKVTAQSTAFPDKTFTARHNHGQDGCANTATTGCTTATAQESLGTVSVGGLPSAVTAPTPTWSNAKGVFSLSNYSAQASATAISGSGSTHTSATASVPITGAPTPELSYWNGTGYTTVALNGLVNQSVTVPKVTAQDSSAAGGSVTVTVTTILSVDAVTTVTSHKATTPTCQTSCLVRKTAPSPARATITYEAVQGATVLCDLVITVDLGAVLASASYQAAS